MTLPTFRFHPDPVASGSVVPTKEICDCCGEARGFRYDGPIYSEEDVPECLCPWCIADGSAQEMYDASFVDGNGIVEEVPEESAEEITGRTPGFATWQREEWPACCGDAMAFVIPAGLEELRAVDRSLEGFALNHIIYNMQISGGAATRLLQSLNRDRGPTAYLFRCLTCTTSKFHIDGP